MSSTTKWNELKGELDGFFGLFIDNLLQLILIVLLCHNVCHIPLDFIYSRIIPGAALSILVGNLFYSWQARRLNQLSGRDDATALPYGINTVSLISFIFLVMFPAYLLTKDWQVAWRLGLVACLGSGLVECLGAFIGHAIRRITPRGSLLSTLSGIAITFISMGFVFRIFHHPLEAIIPALILVSGYASKTKAPFGIPFGFFSILMGMFVVWCERFFWGIIPASSFPTGTIPLNLYLPISCLADIAVSISELSPDTLLSVVIPMGIFCVVGSLQNLESAEAAGDVYQTKSSLLANGVGTIVAAVFGSPFPTTIYIGHPGWKAMGARWRYSSWNGLVICLLSLTGLIALILPVLPVEVMIGVLLWIGAVITAQSFSDVPENHRIGVVIGLLPSLAAWAVMLMEGVARAAGKSLLEVRDNLISQEIFLDGAISLSQGFIISSSILASIVIFGSDRKFRTSAHWCFAAAVLSWFGVIHGYNLTAQGISNNYFWGSAPLHALAYLLTGFIFYGLALSNKSVAENSF